jgi:hypothetical protein
MTTAVDTQYKHEMHFHRFHLQLHGDMPAVSTPAVQTADNPQSYLDYKHILTAV